MVTAINLLKNLFAVIVIISHLLTGGLNYLFTIGAEPWKSVDSVVGIESLARSQGVTTDGENWIFSGKNALEAYSIKTNRLVAINAKAIPDELKDKFNSKHIGGISCYDGKIYAAVEDSDSWLHPLVVTYDAETLEWTGEVYELPVSMHPHGIPWVVTDSEHRVAYVGDGRNNNEIFVHDINTFEYIKTVSLSEPVVKIQGGEYYKGKLYFGSNDITRAVFTVDVNTGKTEKLFDRITYEYTLVDNFGGEGEDITVLPLSDGTFIHTLQTGALFIDTTLRHYKMDKTDD